MTGEWHERAGPWARARLPDGQELDVIVVARARSRDGRWWYECEAVLPVRHEHADGRTEPKGAPAPITVLAEDITPIPGENYAAVPTHGLTSGRPWLAVRAQAADEAEPWWYVHRPDCAQAARGGERQARRITTDEARALLGHARICAVCRPDRGLAAG